jgi:hypothetical protein
MKRQRLVTIDPIDKPTRVLWGIGYPRISALSGVPEGTVRQAVKRGQLDPGDPLALADWIRAQRLKSVARDVAGMTTAGGR